MQGMRKGGCRGCVAPASRAVFVRVRVFGWQRRAAASNNTSTLSTPPGRHRVRQRQRVKMLENLSDTYAWAAMGAVAVA
jgi:hypothetical protein